MTSIILVKLIIIIKTLFLYRFWRENSVFVKNILDNKEKNGYPLNMKKEYVYKINERADYSDINCHAWKGSTVYEHAHRDYYEIIITTRGISENNVGTAFFEQREGDVLIIRPCSYHNIFCKEEGTHFNIAVRADCFERLLSGKPSVKNLLKTEEFLCVSLDEREYAYVVKCIEKISGTEPGAKSYAYAETVLSVILLAATEKSIPEENSREAAVFYCRDALSKIESGSLSDKDASDIYRSYPVSHTLFISEFKKMTGKTPSEYLRESKLIRGRNLLLTTEYSVLDISYEVGYDSVSHFIKCFKKRYGKTPHQYRSCHKKSENKLL